jgi:hypothetical protein
VALVVDVPVAELQIEMTEVAPTSASRVVVSGVELFGLR